MVAQINKTLALLPLLPAGDPKERGTAGGVIFDLALKCPILNSNPETDRKGMTNRVSVKLNLLRKRKPSLVQSWKVRANLHYWSLTEEGVKALQQAGLKPAKKRPRQQQSNGSEATKNSQPQAWIILDPADNNTWDRLVQKAVKSLGGGQIKKSELEEEMRRQAKESMLDPSGMSAADFSKQTSAAISRLNMWAKESV